ncbi:sulfatase family protein [Dyadobacter fanqingshengii]|uniref:Sulfatase n=1 Tax=Dyadobacter fanqingshengii TaxID=2906443 RepID=A0A9X1TAA8_9BACT|nr:sulfatase [Dyadobacter fanqingshengii]MCF0041253.1 sulfatase [Dyadobacter fanqingshengii]USJ37022.1 sulfatase [Dyadobacter fanqingshengii]
MKKFISFTGRYIIGISTVLTLLSFRSIPENNVGNKQKDQRPNIVIIMADDLDSRQLSCYGGQNLKTANIDKLAAQGLKFNNIYASEAMCVPTRASLFTGLYPVRHGSYQNHKPVYDNLKSVGHYLADLGYRVGLTGKDHVTKPKTVFPFDIIEGFEPNCVSPTDEYSLDAVKKYMAADQKPYCLFVMSINPHTPWTSGDTTEFEPDKLKLPADWIDTPITRRQYVKYLAEIRRLDNQVGDITRLLAETGQDKNTIVIFLGEQGAQFPGAKWNLWDSGQKSSMIVKWPGKVKEATETGAIVQYEDITPTLIDLAGGKAIAGLDGKTFLPVLTGKSKTARSYAYGIHNNIPEGDPYPIRSIRDNRYKLIMNLLPDKEYYNRFMMTRERKDRNTVWFSWVDKAVDDPNAKKITSRFVNRPAVEFYDLQKDPFELHNLANDPAQAQLIDKLKKELNAWMKQQGDAGAPIDIAIKK